MSFDTPAGDMDQQRRLKHLTDGDYMTGVSAARIMPDAIQGIGRKQTAQAHRRDDVLMHGPMFRDPGLRRPDQGNGDAEQPLAYEQGEEHPVRPLDDFAQIGSEDSFGPGRKGG